MQEYPSTIPTGRSPPVIRASCAYPGLFVPIQYDGRTLVDGFLTAPVPIEGTLLLGADLVIAVYLEAATSSSLARSPMSSAARSTSCSGIRSGVAHPGGHHHRAGCEAVCVGRFHENAGDGAAGEAAALAALPQIRAALSREKRDSAA